MDLNYSVIYSKRKKLSITVERDRSIVVRAPEGTSPEKIQSVIESKKQWLFEKTHHPQKYASLPHPPGKELVNGESILYLGRYYRMELVDSSGDIRFHNRFFIPKAMVPFGRRALRHWFKKRAEEKINPRVQHYSKSLGAEYNLLNITNSKYRWGSCSTKDNLNLNWRLIKAPMFVIDYIIVHELAHLIEGNHTPRFWNIVRAQVADLDKAKKWLRENGQLLESDI